MTHVATRYAVYWQPGCTSCLRTKELLRSHGVEFESINVRETPRALETLAALGARSVPVVVRGRDFVLGQDIDEVARFVGIVIERERLPRTTLVELTSCFLPSTVSVTTSRTGSGGGASGTTGAGAL